MPLMRETKLIDDKLKMCGVFDRIDKITNDEYAIVEYKTSKKFDKPSIQRQLTFYKVLWENTLNKGKSNISGISIHELKSINLSRIIVNSKNDCSWILPICANPLKRTSLSTNADQSSTSCAVSATLTNVGCTKKGNNGKI